MSATLTAAELARRTRRHGVRIDERIARGFLEEWRDRGIAHEVRPGQWALTPSGAAKYSGFGLGLDDPGEVAA